MLFSYVSLILCVTIMLQRTRMSDGSETVEDTEKGSLAEVTDDSCTVDFIEIVPLDRASDGYHKLEFIDPVVVVKQEDLQELKQESADDSETEAPCFNIQVCSAYSHS